MRIALLLSLVLVTPAAPAADYAVLPAGTLTSVLAGDADKEPVAVSSFAMRATPVTQGEFRSFVADHPKWQRGRIPRAFADNGYLKDWPTAVPVANGAAQNQPVVNVSWFAAQAFCEGEGGRLPTWQEWEYAAAADATRHDARADPAWRARILNWYARSTKNALPAVGGEANAYGVRDLHGLIWEWVDDFNALLVSPCRSRTP